MLFVFKYVHSFFFFNKNENKKTKNIKLNWNLNKNVLKVFRRVSFYQMCIHLWHNQIKQTVLNENRKFPAKCDYDFYIFSTLKQNVKWVVSRDRLWLLKIPNLRFWYEIVGIVMKEIQNSSGILNADYYKRKISAHSVIRKTHMTTYRWPYVKAW